MGYFQKMLNVDLSFLWYIAKIVQTIWRGCSKVGIAAII